MLHDYDLYGLSRPSRNDAARSVNDLPETVKVLQPVFMPITEPWQYYWVDLFGLSLYDKLYRQLTNPETDEIKQAFRSVTKGDRAFTDRHGWDDGYADYINGENPGAGPWSRRRLIVAGMWLSC